MAGSGPDWENRAISRSANAWDQLNIHFFSVNLIYPLLEDPDTDCMTLHIPGRFLVLDRNLRHPTDCIEKFGKLRARSL